MLSAAKILPPLRLRPYLTALVVALMAPMLSACGINAIPTYQEQARAAWSQVENQYQRRADLIPNLIETVKGFAARSARS